MTTMTMPAAIGKWTSQRCDGGVDTGRAAVSLTRTGQETVAGGQRLTFGLSGPSLPPSGELVTLPLHGGMFDQMKAALVAGEGDSRIPILDHDGGYTGYYRVWARVDAQVTRLYFLHDLDEYEVVVKTSWLRPHFT